MAEATEPAAAREGAAGGVAVTDVPLADADARSGEVRATLEGRRFTAATEVAVLEHGRFAGVVPIEALLASAPEARVGDLVEPTGTVSPEADVETAARATARRGGNAGHGSGM